MQVKRKSNGQVINLGSEIARGGEGAIHPYPPDASLVAKVYHAHKLKDIDIDKLQLMLANPPDDSVAKSHGCVSIAWPVDLLLSINSSQSIIGFLMPRVSMQQVRPIHDYYSPKTRREKNLGFNYLSLHRTARNFAAAMSALHAKQYVIGDVNESNILVYDTAMVTLVDTDSFQVRDLQKGKVYRCRVGKPEYTPPELQGKRFADYDRTPEHDLFGLGVLIFQLLMEGEHPFVGVYQGSGEPPPTEKRILAGHFPHGTKKVPYNHKPMAVRFEVLHPTLRQLFIRCFEDGHNNPQARPDARTWVKALEAAEKDLVSCGVNSEHKYGGHLRDCPWCERKKLLRGIDPFPAISGGQSNIFAQIPLQPASKPKPVSSPAPSPTPSPTAIPYQPTPTPAPTTTYATFSPLTPTPTATPKFNTPSLPTRKFLDKAWRLGGIAAVLSVSFFLFYPHQDPELKDKQKHFTDYIQAIQLDSNSADAYNKRGLVRYDLGDKQGAIADYTKAIQVDPKFAEAYNNMGDANHDLEDQQGAIANYKKAIQVDPKFSEAYKNLGHVHSHLGDNKAAIEAYNQAIKLNPKYAEAYLGLGKVRSDLGDNQAAIEDYTKAIQLNPTFADAYNGRGTVHHELGDKKAAIEDYTKAIQLNPKPKNAAIYYYNRGRCYYILTDTKAAIEDYNKAIQLDPKFAFAYSALGLTRSDLGYQQAAIQDLNQAIQLDPKFAIAYNNRGLARARLGEKKAAIQDYNQAIQLDPKLALAYYNRGSVRSDLRDKKGALEDLNQAIQLDAKFANVYYNRGFVRSQLGDKKGAIEDYQQAAQIDQKEGKTEEYQQSIDQIRKLQQ